MDPTEVRNRMTAFFMKNHDVDPNNLYKPRDSDLMCVGPMKSGTTWMVQILHQLRTKGDESFDDIYAVTRYILNPGTPMNVDLNAEQAHSPRVFKHHEAHGVIATTDKQKKIVIIRDPYDAAYSYTKFINRFYGGDNDMSDEEAFKRLQDFHKENKNSNFATLATWWEHKGDPDVLLVFYEDLKKDLKHMIQKIADFVAVVLDEHELAKVTHFCSFEYMSKNKDKFDGQSDLDDFATSVGIAKFKPTMGMVRQDGGKIGQGAVNLGPQVKSAVDEFWSQVMEKKFGYKSYQEMYEKNSCVAC